MNVPDTLGIALANLAKGIVSIPCREGTKVPLVKWKEWQTKLPPEELIRQWFRQRCNIAIICTGLVLFDVDDPEKEKLVVSECGETSHKLKTPRGGVHLGYRRRKGVAVGNSVKIKGEPIDIRTDGGLEMIPNSETEHGRYEWLGAGLRPFLELPLAKVGWTRERTRKRTRSALSEPGVLPEGQGSIRFPEQYCLQIRSVQGRNGSRGLVRVVCVMRDAGRTPQQTLDYALTVWNPACADPPWSEDEIRHAIRRHYGIADF